MKKPQPSKPVLELLTVLTAYAKARGVSEARVSTEILAAGTRIQRLRDGGEIGVTAWHRAMERMSGDWPEDSEVAWPAGIERPAPAEKPKAKESRRSAK